MYFLRFTKNPARDLKRGYSFHYDGDGGSVRISGLCGFRLDAENIADAIEEVKEEFSSRTHNRVYNIESWGYEWAIFEGEECEEWLPDGVVFTPKKIVYQPGRS